MIEKRTKRFRIRPQAPDGYFTITQAAEYLGISARSVSRYIHERGLPASKPGGVWFIKKSDLIEWVKRYE